ncbi:MAG: hypothetical protein HY394_05710 [Candidatus Diapherotrites archaeon]|nr:hypothetical protein [Candidatus Diapherotrites archaeon]
MRKILLAALAVAFLVVLMAGFSLAQANSAQSAQKSEAGNGWFEGMFQHMNDISDIREKAVKENWSDQKFFDAMQEEMQEHWNEMPCHNAAGFRGGMMGNSAGNGDGFGMMGNSTGSGYGFGMMGSRQ